MDAGSDTITKKDKRQDHNRSTRTKKQQQTATHHLHFRTMGEENNIGNNGAAPTEPPALSDTETFVLNALLFDERGDAATTPSTAASLTRPLLQQVLSADMLFSSVPNLSSPDTTPKHIPPKPQRPSILGLWKAHGDGVDPKQLINMAGSFSKSLLTAVMHPTHNNSNNKEVSKSKSHEPESTAAVNNSNNNNNLQGLAVSDNDTRDDETPPTNSTLDTMDYEDDNNIPSDDELRPEDRDGDESDSASSWGDDEHWDNYDTWDVLKDEYATDFGFSFDAHGMVKAGNSVEDQDDDDDQNVFLILGTSADDKSCQPHVLSPPLMDSLMTFVPHNLHNENYWLKFSLIRDGASLHTLKRYVRASSCTILAIETTKGEVFGSFTSHTWSNHCGFYGSQPAFVWKMRHSRRTKVSSLFDQAQLESEIDVFMYTGGNDFVQVCHHDFLAVGGDHALPILLGDSGHHDYNFTEQDYSLRLEDLPDRNGFAITLEDDLLNGTTSPSATFKNPALCGKGDATETFQVAGLEVWTFTPARTVDAAEKLEMTKYFVQQSSRNVSAVDSTTSSLRSTTLMNGKDFSQKDFYRRVGDDSD